MNDIAERLLSILRGKKTREPDVGSYCITMLHIDWQISWCTVTNCCCG